MKFSFRNVLAAGFFVVGSAIAIIAITRPVLNRDAFLLAGGFAIVGAFLYDSSPFIDALKSWKKAP